MNTQVMMLDTTCIGEGGGNQLKLLSSPHRPERAQRSSSTSSVCSNSTRGSRRSTRRGSCSSIGSRKGRALRFQSPTGCSKNALSTPYDNYHDVLMSPVKAMPIMPAASSQPSTPRTPTCPTTPSPIVTPASVTSTPYVVNASAMACFDLFEDSSSLSAPQDNDTVTPPLHPKSPTKKIKSPIKKSKKKMERYEVPLTQLVDYNDYSCGDHEEDDLQSKETARTVSTCSVSTAGSISESPSSSQDGEKSVSFQKTITVHEVPSRKNLKHKDQIWYTKKEAEVMKQNVYVMTRLLKSQLIAFDVNDQPEDDELCSWGLHQATTTSAVQRGNQNLDSSSTTTQRRRIDTIKTVLEEQELQREMYDMDCTNPNEDVAVVHSADYAMNSELLATIYHTMTKESSIEAYQRGVAMHNELQQQQSVVATDTTASKAKRVTFGKSKKGATSSLRSKNTMRSASPMRRRASLNLFRKS